MRRHWITTSAAVVCFTTATAEIFSLIASLPAPGIAGHVSPLMVVWRILGLFPTPSVAFWPVSLILGVAAPALIPTKLYAEIVAVGTLASSLIVGIAIWRMQKWVRFVLIALCALTIAAQVQTLYPLVFYSPGLLQVLQANFAGRPAAYVAGAGPGSILASIIIAISLLRWFVKNGLHVVETTGAGSENDSAPPQSRERRAHQALLFATTAAIVIESLLLVTGLGQEGQALFDARLLLAVLLAPNVLILARCWRKCDRVALGLAAGYGVLTTYITAIFLPALLFGLLWIAGSHERGAFEFFILMAIPPLQGSAAVAAIILTRSLPPLPAGSPTFGVWGLAFLFPLVAGTALPQFYFDWQRGNLPIPGMKSGGDEYHELVRRDQAAHELVLKYGYCAFLYAKSHPDTGFPENAEQMGPAGTACLKQDEAKGRPEGYSLRYVTQKSDNAARLDHFTVAVQLNNQRQINGALMDEKGIPVFATSQNVQSEMVTAESLSWNTPDMYKSGFITTPVWMLPHIEACAAALRDKSASSEYPSMLAEILPEKIQPHHSDCLNRADVTGLLMRTAAHSNRATGYGYVLDYQPTPGADGKLTHFNVTLRPEHYGIDGIRSYSMDDSGKVHATPEDRPATADDPLALSCEIEGLCTETGTL